MSHPTEMVFPATRCAGSRILTLRNPTKQTFATKVSTSSHHLKVSPICAVIKPGRSFRFKVTLSEPKMILGTEGCELLVLCHPVVKTSVENVTHTSWFETPKGRCAEIARRINVAKSLGNSAVETVLDLPGDYWQTTLTIDDSNTNTARNVESETLTAHIIDDDSIMDVVSMEVNMDEAGGDKLEDMGSRIELEDCEESPGMNNEGCGWMNELIDTMFPPANGTQSNSFPCGSV